MQKRPLLFLFLLCLLCACGRKEQFSLETEYLKIRIDGEGNIFSFRDKQTGKEYSPENRVSPLLSLYRDSVFIKPSYIAYHSGRQTITLSYPNGSVAELSVTSKKTYLRFQLLSLEPRNGVEAVVWGPYATTLDQQIGETIGVVRGKQFAIGMQGLNINTVEGVPGSGDDDAGGGAYIDPLPGQSLPDSLKSRIGQKVAVDVNKNGDLPAYVRLYRGSAAKKTFFGSEIRLFARDRRKARVLRSGNTLQYVDSINVDLTGTAIALFGCPEPATLDVIGEIELGEGLPHPMLDGVWVKKSPWLGQAYMMYEDGKNWKKCLSFARACGFRMVHLGDVFKTWGHFGLNTDRFPNGAEGIRRLAELAGKDGIRLGIHTLTLFTGTNDAYVSPVPSDSLCKTGSSVLVKNTGAGDEVIFIKDPDYFRNAGSTHTVKIGKELIAYGKVSAEKPWRLMDCIRGQFGTFKTGHAAGDTIDKLVNNDYKGFYPDIRLQDQYAKRLAEVCRETGIGLMDFDGFGGASPGGQGAYGAARFLDLWYKNLDSSSVLACGAGTFHYGWHIHSFMNWGEPWYNALRQSQVNYRIENQRYFKRNLLPGMLGWFTLQDDYRPEEIEWIQARSAGFNAGYLLKVEDDIEKDGYKDQLFEAVREWQKARALGAFSPSQMERMRDAANEFHLEKKTDSTWNLYPVKLQAGFEHRFREVQSGEPLTSTFHAVNPYETQPIRFYIITSKANGDAHASVSAIKITINNYQILEINEPLKAGQNLVCDGKEMYICDANWNKIKPVAVSRMPVWDKGNNEIAVNSKFSGDPAIVLKLEFKFVGPPEKVGSAGH